MPGGVATQISQPPLVGTLPVYKYSQTPEGQHADREKGNKVRAVVLATIAFAVLSHMAAYRIAESINQTITGIPNTILSEYTGQPTFKGGVIMTALFFAIMVYLMS